MITKSIKLYLHKPLNATWEEVGQRLRDLRYQQCKILNFGITQFYLYQYDKENFKTLNGKYPTNQELPMPQANNLQSIKKKIKEDCQTWSSYQTDAVSAFLKSKWQNECKDTFYYCNRSLSSFRKTFPVLFRNTAYKLNHDKINGYTFKVTHAGKKYDGVRHFEFQLSTLRMKNSMTTIIDRILTGQYKQGEIKIKFDEKKKKWFVVIAYSFEPEEIKLDENIICGIDLGVSVPFYAAISNSLERLTSCDKTEIFKFRHKIRVKRREIQRQYPFSKRKGRGRKKALLPLTKLQEKVNDFRDNKYHTYSKHIVDFCVKNQAGTIQLEDLSSINQSKQEDGFMKDWNIHALHKMIEYKAKEYGIKVVYVDPAYTSQRCSSCGYISRENRKDQAHFECVACGYKENADYNAARNLSVYQIDEIIKASLIEFKKAA